ncbi:MAG: hypothetical protein ACJAS3_000942 [Roseivirga sp.]
MIDKWHQSELEERKVGVVEIDIEGAELLVLRSCINLIKKYSPVLYFEVNTEALKVFQSVLNDPELLLTGLAINFSETLGQEIQTMIYLYWLG